MSTESMEERVSKLDNLRKHLGLSNNAFAKQIGLDPSHWSLIRNGKRRLTLEAIEKVLQAYPAANSIFPFYLRMHERREKVLELDNLRKHLGLDNNAFAKQIGISSSSWSLIRAGKRPLRDEVIEKVLRAYPSTGDIFQSYLRTEKLPTKLKNNRYSDRQTIS